MPNIAVTLHLVSVTMKCSGKDCAGHVYDIRLGDGDEADKVIAACRKRGWPVTYATYPMEVVTANEALNTLNEAAEAAKPKLNS